MINNTTRLNGIQLLRAIAVLLVVHCHILDRQMGRGGSRQQSFFYLQNFGAAGVDIFFVISGFIITLVATPYAQLGQGQPFFIKRILRVVPLYWLVSLLATFLFYQHTGNMVRTVAIEKTLLFYPFIDNSAITGPIVFQGWTLSFELLFYAVTAFFIRLGSKKCFLGVLLFFSACILFNYALGIHWLLMVFLGNGIMLEFLLGVCCGLLFLSGIRFSAFQVHALLFAGIAGFLASLVLGFGAISESVNTLNGTQSLLRSAVWGIPAALLVGGMAMKEKGKPLPVNPLWIAIGNASFSIYLTHVLIIQSLYARWTKWGIQGKWPPDLQVLITLAAVIALGYLFYLLVEKPILRRLKAFGEAWISRAWPRETRG